MSSTSARSPAIRRVMSYSGKIDTATLSFAPLGSAVADPELPVEPDPAPPSFLPPQAATSTSPARTPRAVERIIAWTLSSSCRSQGLRLCALPRRSLVYVPPPHAHPPPYPSSRPRR